MPKGKGKGFSNSKGEKLQTYSPYFKINNEVRNETIIKQNEKNNLLQGNYVRTIIQPKRKIFNFFNQECIHLAKALLGKLLVHIVNGKRTSGFIVETECYLGDADAASHSYQGKKTRRTEPMFMKPGTSYVYSIYGMYYCFNISSKEKGSCVLIRALEPFENLEEMELFRQVRQKSKSQPLKFTQLTSGPSKLCQSLNINKKNCNKLDMNNSSEFWVEDGVEIMEGSIVITKRIGIDSYGEESANKPLRFYVLGNPCVSVKDKKAEQNLFEVHAK